MTTPETPPTDDPLEILQEEARAVAQCFGVATCDEAAAALVDRIILRLGGGYIYVPRRGTRERLRVQAEIRRRFDGLNGAALAKEFGLTPRHIRRLVRKTV